ncbi:MAG: tetratricopeptide repeat protein [Deltaproteobacteria bacterium]|nr:tetratricopeptide repeat protein [Deltaproteobacteria bacterium]
MTPSKTAIAVVGLLAFAGPTGLGGGRALADDVDQANATLGVMEDTVRRLSSSFRENAPPEANIAERRLVDAQTQFELKNYGEAATLLFDVIERFPDTRVYDEALVLMGESLFISRDLLGAQRYFQKAVEKKNSSRAEQQALQRLVEIALRTGDLEGIDQYLTRLADIPPAQLEPSVPYVRGKFLFFRDRGDEAEKVFNSISPENPYYLQSRYLLATVFVKRGDLATAATGFDNVLKLQPKNESDREIQELARLALGRIYFDRGQLDQAKAMYVSLDRQSKYFADAMYESAWTAIKAGDFKTAYRALDLLLLQDPDSPRAPELRLLMGNLNLRLSNFYVASDTFSKTREEFEPVYQELTKTLERSSNDPAYFQTLVGQDLSKFDISVFVPGSAAKWVKGEPEVERVVVLASDVTEIRKGITESEDLIHRLDVAVGGQGKVGIFPDLADVRTQSSEVLNKTMDVRRRFAASLRKQADPYLSAEDKAALARNDEERGNLETQLKDLPLTAEDLKKRDRGTQGQLSVLDARSSEVNVMIQGLEAELVAIETYYQQSKNEQKISLEDVKSQSVEIRKTIDELRSKNTVIRTEIEDASRQNTAAGAAGEGERYAVMRLSQLIAEEADILRNAREKLPSNDRSTFDRQLAVLSRADGVQQSVTMFDDRVDKVAEGRLEKLRTGLETERNNLKSAADKLTSLTTESQDVGGGLAQTIVGRVKDRFYEVVVQSDVGLIDVAWGLKDDKTQKLSKLINQQKNELKALDEDFRGILEEEK